MITPVNYCSKVMLRFTNTIQRMVAFFFDILHESQVKRSHWQRYAEIIFYSQPMSTIDGGQ
jgi:hypothetical protein